MSPEKKNEPVVISTHLPEFKFVVDGAEYSLRYDFAAFEAYEKQTGIDPFTPEFEISAKNIKALLWAGLRSYHPDVTLEKILDWLTPSTLRALTGVAADAFEGAFPPKEELEVALPNPPSA